MRTYLLDDEAHARGLLKHYLKAFTFVTLIGENGSPTSAIDEINRLKPELLFLDISMPVLNGMEVLSSLEADPLVIFLTAHDEFALEAFKQNAVDYLVKPIDEERLSDSLRRARKRLLGRQQTTTALAKGLTRVIAHKGDEQRIIWLNNIAGFSKDGRYTQVTTLDGESLTCEATLGHFEEQLLHSLFFRINRSDIVRKDLIRSFEAVEGGTIDLHMVDGSINTVSRRRARQFREWVCKPESLTVNS